MDEQDLYKINQYIRGELSGTELEAFVQKMHSDKAFAEEVDLEKEIMEMTADKDIIELRQIMDEVKDTSVLSKEKVKRSTYSKYIKYVIAVAIISILIVLAIIYRNTNTVPTNEKLFAQYYEKHSVENMRSGIGNLSDDFELALDAYEKVDFEKALGHLEEELVNNPDKVQVQFLATACYLELGRYEDAITLLSSIMEDRNNSFIHIAKWNLALTLLKTDDVEKAKVLLREIISDESDYKQQASEILEKLE